MRQVSNDVILTTPALELRHRASFWQFFAMLVVIVAVISPTSSGAGTSFEHDSNTDPSPTYTPSSPSSSNSTSSTNTNHSRMVIMHTNVIYVCDPSSSEHCRLETVQSWTLRQLYSFYPNSNLNANHPCHLQNNTTCTSSSHHQATNSNDNTADTSSINDTYIMIQARLSDSVSLLIRISFHNVSGGVYELMKDLNHLITVSETHVVVCVGRDVTVQTTAIVAEALGIPVIGYVTKDGNLKHTIQGRTFTSLNPGPEAQGMVLAQIIGKFNMKQMAVIIQDTKMADGFLHGVRKVSTEHPSEDFHVLCLNSSASPEDLLNTLMSLSATGWKLMVVHTDPNLMVDVITTALSTRLYNTGHAWFLSQDAFSRNESILSQLPEGLLAIDSLWLGGIPDLMVNALDHLVTAFALLFREGLTTAILDNVPYDNARVRSDDRFPSQSTHDNLPQSVLHVSNWTWDGQDQKDFTRNLHTSVFCSRFITVEHGDPPCDDELLLQFINSSDFSHSQQRHNDHKRYNTTRRKKRRRAIYNIHEGTYANTDNSDVARGPAYSLLNTVAEGFMGDLMWSRVGYITIKGWQDLRTVLWPGHNIYGPAANSVKTYRVVTRKAEPFVFITSKVNRKEKCLLNRVCLQVFNTSKDILTRIVDDFQTDGNDIDRLYTIHCCWGIALELMQTLAQDLNFKFVVYFVNDTDYGSLQDGVWTGMVGDLVNGAADAIAGAFSITAQRMTEIHYTEPFYNNEYAQASGQDGNDVSIWAFTSPFSGQVWMCIFMSSIVAGIATAFLEWHSPFGLNPRGRKRTKNYGLGSGLLMVMVLITGHTINIKAPKSWPGKLIQNVWAGLAIFIMTSYTANLAAYLAGQSAVTAASNIFDRELLAQKAAVIPSSAVEAFLNKINAPLGRRTKENYVDSTAQAISLLSEREIDVYFDDTVLLEYALTRNDKDCRVHISGKGFGSDGYAIGLAKHSWWLQIPMSNMISLYTDSGFVQDLASKYVARPQCRKNFVVGTATAYGLEHTGGLFFILLSSILCAILLLICEHVTYHFAVPWMRRQAPHSFWKTENLGFISQRVSRVVRSERLYSQKQAAQEMIKIVKQRDFTRLIQKNELQKRKNPVQKKVKTKAEVFQEITANIVSYHRQLQSASEDADTVASSDNADYIQQGISSVDSTTGDTAGFSPDLMGVNNTGYATDSVELTVDDYYLGQISDCEEEDSRETAFTFDNHGDFSNEISDVECSNSLNLPRRMSSTSWAFPPRQLTDNPVLQRHSTFRRPLKPVKKKTATSSPLSRVPLNDTDYGTQTQPYPSKQSISCDNQHQRQQPLHQHQNVELFHCIDSDNELDTNLPPPVLSTSSLCLSSFSANSSLFFPSPPSSQVQSPSEDKNHGASLITSMVSDRSRDTANVPGVSDMYAMHDNNTHSNRVPPRAPEIPLDPVVLDSSNMIPTLSTDVMDPSANDSYLPGRFAYSEMPPSHEDDLFGGHPKSSARSNRVYNDHDSNDSVFIELPTDPEQMQNHKRKGPNSSSSNGISELDKNVRKYSDLSDYRLPSANLSGVNITQRRKSYDKQSRDYFKRNIKLKDNRVKSTLRHHAMSGYQSTLPADFIDECTLEALSKEDLLVLWKKSEIELEGRLNEVLDRNRRLGLAIEFLSQSEKQERLTEV